MKKVEKKKTAERKTERKDHTLEIIRSIDCEGIVFILSIWEDLRETIEVVEGSYEAFGVDYRVTMNRLEDNKHSYRIRTSLFLPNFGNSSGTLLAFKDYRSHNYNIEELCKEAVSLSEKLYIENLSTILRQKSRIQTKDSITFDIALYKGLPGFIHGKSNASYIRKKLSAIIQNGIGVKISDCPENKIDEMLRKSKCDNKKCRLLLKQFISYCIEKEICACVNPVNADESSSIKSIESQDFHATMSEVLDSEALLRLWKNLYSNISYVSVALAFRLSGFTYEQILNLKWCNIYAVNNYNGKHYHDFVIVEIYREKIKQAIHNFSRPLIPPAAELILQYEKQLISEGKINDATFSRDNIEDEYIIPRSEEQYSDVNIKAWEYDRLLAAGLNNMISKSVNGKKFSASSNIMDNIYKFILLNRCGINNEDETYKYLTGGILRDTGFINYQSHSTMGALFRYYTILQHFQIEEENKRRKITTIDKSDSSSKILILPKTNRENAAAIITLKMTKGQYLKCLTDHGLYEYVEVKRCDTQDTIKDLSYKFDTLKSS